jgi:hypothetical protein
LRTLPLDEGGDRSSESEFLRPRLMSSVETDIIWTGSRARAESLMAAVSPDDPETFEAEIVEVEGGVELRIRVVGEELKTVRSTIDDLLACLAAAETSLDVSD